MSNIVPNQICYVFIQNSFLLVASEIRDTPKPIILRIDDRKSTIVAILDFKIGSNFKDVEMWIWYFIHYTVQCPDTISAAKLLEIAHCEKNQVQGSLETF